MITPLLNFISVLYKTGSFIVLKFRSLRGRQFSDTKIISIDNLSFGGTGKTPMVMEVAGILKDAEVKFSIVTRGYGSLNKESSLLVKKEHTWKEVGDEVKMMTDELPGIDIFKGSDRVRSITGSIKRGNSVVILDDGFQSAGIKKDLKIMLINPEQNYYYLRNFKFMAKSEDVILYYKGIKSRKPGYRIRKKEHYGEYSFEFSSFQTPDGLPADPGQLPVFGFSALGDNERFKSDLAGLNLKGFQGFRDHHVYSGNDLETLEKRMKSSGADFLVCTHKDFVKITDTLTDGFPLIYIKNRIKCDFDLKGSILSIIE